VSGPRHFLDVDQLSAPELRDILTRAGRRKAARADRPAGAADADAPLQGRILAAIFEKPSTRTRVSFDVAIRQLGGESLVLNSHDLQLGRGETIADTARVLSRFVDAIVLRTFEHEKLIELARHATVPVINGLTNDSHPCQLMADVMTFEEHKGAIAGRVLAWSGDGNNMLNSWIHGAARFGYRFRIACPDALRPAEALVRRARADGAEISLHDDPGAAVQGADAVVTDTWISMGDDVGDRHNLLRPFQVDGRLMARAQPDAVFLHCLPAHRGEEVTAEVIDGPRSVVFDQAENRLHAQKGILAWCLNG